MQITPREAAEVQKSVCRIRSTCQDLIITLAATLTREYGISADADTLLVQLEPLWKQTGIDDVFWKLSRAGYKALIKGKWNACSRIDERGAEYDQDIIYDSAPGAKVYQIPDEGGETP